MVKTPFEASHEKNPVPKKKPGRPKKQPTPQQAQAQAEQNTAKDDKIKAVYAALANIDTSDSENFNDSGVPKLDVVMAKVGFPVPADWVPELWRLLQEQLAAAEAGVELPPAPVTLDEKPIEAVDPLHPEMALENRLQDELQAKLDQENERLTVHEQPAPVPPSGQDLDSFNLPAVEEVQEAPWHVADLNAKTSARLHDLGNGVTYALHARQTVPMPRAHAVKFLSSGSFVVFNERGIQVDSLNGAHEQAGMSVPQKLADNEVVVRVSELSQEALLIRVNRMPGGEIFNNHSPREAIEAFFVETRRKLNRARPDPDVLSDAQADSTPDVAVAQSLEQHAPSQADMARELQMRGLAAQDFAA